MELKTKQQIEQQVKNYLDKTSKHLFVTESGYLYKVLPLYKDDKLYVVTITAGKGQLLIQVQEAVNEYVYKYSGNGTANVVKRNLFPEYYKTKSIPYFKKMRNLVDDIMKEIKVDNKANQELAEKLKERVAGLELVKE